MARCQACKKRQAIYAAQFMGEDVPTFSLLGSHYRGFKVIKVCEVCKDINVEGIRQAAQQTLAAELLSSSNNQASADQPQPAEA